MSDQESCFVCRKHKGLEFVPGGPVFEDESVYAGHSWSVEDQQAPYLGGFIVEPKRHVPGWAELDDEESAKIGKVIRDVSNALKEDLQAEHVYVFVLGHNVPHLHVWVIPRYPDTPREYWGFHLFDWPDRPIGESEDVERICESMRSRMA